MIVLLVLAVSYTNFSLKILRINFLPVSALHSICSDTAAKKFAYIISGGAQIFLRMCLDIH